MKASQQGNYVWFYCPGCKTNHKISTKTWAWNLDLNKPTFNPSVLVDYGDGRKCHIFVKEGKIQYLSDCFHDLKNQTIEMEDI